MTALPTPFAVKGGGNMLELLRFLISVAASVIGNYISKWLDGD